MDKNLEAVMNMTPEEIFKAVKDAKGLEGIRIIKDLWEDIHAIPDVNTTKTGPTMHSSGSGADKAMHEYSNPAPQVGNAEAYNEFTQSNIEGWGKMHEAFKANIELQKSSNESITSALGALTEAILKKSEGEEKKEEKKEEKMEEKKSESCGDMKSRVATLWSNLAELEVAVAKAEESEAGDIKKLGEAKKEVEGAEKHIDETEKHEKEEAAHKAQVAINTGWSLLVKATGLSAHDLHGYGNQEDAQVPGDSTKDESLDDLKAAEAKSNFYTLKANRLRKSKGLPALKVVAKAEEEKMEEKKEEKKEEAKSEVANLGAEVKSEDLVALKAQLDAEREAFAKSCNDRIAEINRRMESVSGRTATTMVPVLIKSNGVRSDSEAGSFNDKIEQSFDAGELNEDEASVARNLIDRYRAAGKGIMSVEIVNKQLDAAPLNVQQFFKSFEASASI